MASSGTELRQPGIVAALRTAIDQLRLLGRVYDRVESEAAGQQGMTTTTEEDEMKRRELEDLFVSVESEVTEAGTFQALLGHVRRHRETVAQDDARIDKIKAQRAETENLRWQLRKQTLDAVASMSELDDSIVIHKMQIQRAKRDFAKRVQDVQQEHRKCVGEALTLCKHKEESLKRHIKKLQETIEDEVASHQDAANDFRRHQATLEERARRLRGQHTVELCTTKLQTLRLQMKLREAAWTEVDLEKKLSRVSEELEDERRGQWEDRRLVEELRIASATKIQNWWRKLRALRHLMSRRHRAKRHDKDKRKH